VVAEGGDEVTIDALPYIDNEYDLQGMKEMVTHLIEEEKKRYRPTKNYLEHLPQLEMHRFETPLQTKEYERLQQRLPMEVLSMKRYELPPPPSGKLTDVSAWSECVDNSYAQLEHQFTRICNLELQLEYGCESWKTYLEVLTRMVNSSQQQLQKIKQQIQEVNWSRKQSQTQTGEQLRILESSWVGLVSKNYEIDRACGELERGINAAIKKKNAITTNDTTTEEKEKEEEEQNNDDSEGEEED